MGNYSYLLYVTNNCKKTLIDISKIPDSGNNDYIYTFSDEFKNIKTLQDFAEYKNGGKLFGYMTQDTIKTIESISQNSIINNDDKEYENNHPRMYFEYEGWDEIYYLEFIVGHSIVNVGKHAFNFNDIYFEKQMKEIYFDEKDEHIIHEKVNEIRKQYMLNLIFDKFTNWNVNKLDSSQKESNEIGMSVLLMLAGIRIEDYIDNPEKSKEHLRKVFNFNTYQ
jgi:hypothetical protein